MKKLIKIRNLNLEKIKYIEFIKAEFYLGSKKMRWNPMLLGYIYKMYNKIYILNLEYTIFQLNRGLSLIKLIIRNRGQLLLVVLKKKLTKTIQLLLKKSKQGYVDNKYYNGSLITFAKSKRLLYQKLQGILDINLREKTLQKLLGYKNLQQKPSAVIITNITKSDWLIRECNKLRIPTISFIDSNTMCLCSLYSIIGNSKINKTLNMIILFIYHAIFQGIRLDTKIFNINYNLTKKIFNKIRIYNLYLKFLEQRKIIKNE